MKVYILIVFAIINVSCTQAFKNRMVLDKAASLYEKGKNEDNDPALLEAGREYQKIINQKVYAQERLAAIYRTLGERSLAKMQYGYSAQYFAEGLKILPSSTYLRYGLGISYANLIESADTPEKKNEFTEKAAANIKYSVDGDPANANYNAAYASLLTMHLNKSAEALPYIEKALSISSTNIDYLFVLARIQFDTGNDQAAANTYRRIISITPDERIKRQAEDNINQLSGR